MGSAVTDEPAMLEIGKQIERRNRERPETDELLDLLVVGGRYSIGGTVASGDCLRSHRLTGADVRPGA